MSDNGEKQPRFKAPFSFLKNNPIMWFWWLILIVSVLSEISYFIHNDCSFERLAESGKLDFGGLALIISSLVTMGLDFFYDGFKNIERKFKIINGIVASVGVILLIVALVLRDFSGSMLYQLLVGLFGYAFSFIAFLCNFFPKDKEMKQFEDGNYANETRKTVQELTEKTKKLTDDIFESKEEKK